MVKKKAKAADTFRRAAFAAGAFKPRAGGAAARLFAKDNKPSDEADGINAVFVPQRMKEQKEEAAKKAEEVAKEPEPEKAEKAEKAEAEQTAKEQPAAEAKPVPSVTVSAPIVTAAAADNDVAVVSPNPEKPATKPKKEPEVEARKKKRRSNQQILNVSRLGIDPTVIEDRGLKFENLLAEFSWWGSDLSKKNIEAFEHDIKLEIARVEAGSWLNHLEQKDDRVEAVEKMLDRAIAECDELEGLLTLYNVELSVRSFLVSLH